MDACRDDWSKWEIFNEKIHKRAHISTCQTRSSDVWIMNVMCTFVIFSIYIYEVLKLISVTMMGDVLMTFLMFMSFILYRTLYEDCPVSWGCRIHWLHLCRGVRPPLTKCPGYDTKQSDGEVPAMLELWGMRSTPSLPSLPGPLWPRVVAPDRALSMG